MPASRKTCRLRFVAKLFAAASAFLLSAPAYGAVKQLSSSAGSTAVWTTNSNWSPTPAPTSTDDVIFDYTNEAGTKTIIVGLNATGAGGSANSLTFGGSTAHGALSTFTFQANSSSSSTARTLTLGTSGQTGAGSISVDSSVIGTQSIGTQPAFWGVMNITLAAGVSGFTVTNNSTTQLLDLAANLNQGATAGSTLSLTSAGGVIQLSGASTYTGATTISGTGVVKIDNNATTTARLAGTTSMEVQRSGGNANVSAPAAASRLVDEAPAARHVERLAPRTAALLPAYLRRYSERYPPGH